MSFEEERRKAFDFCADATKQLITLSSAIVAFTVTFGKDFLGAVPAESRLFAYIAWGAHLLSILLGLLVLLALTAQLQPKKTPPDNYVPSIRGAPATYSGLQIISFLAAMCFTALFGFKAASAPQPLPPTPTASIETRLAKLETEMTLLAAALRSESETRAKSDAESKAQAQRLASQITDLRRSARMQPCRQPSSPSVECCARAHPPSAICKPQH